MKKLAVQAMWYDYELNKLENGCIWYCAFEGKRREYSFSPEYGWVAVYL